jgi:putative tricarboxylic transport membrane protein
MIGLWVRRLSVPYKTLRRALTLSRSNPTIFLQRPISAAMLLAAVLALGIFVLPAVGSAASQAFRE